MDLTATTGHAIQGTSTATSGYVIGVRGQIDSTSGDGVYGYASASSGDARGVNGWSDSSAGRGVSGYARAASGTTYGVYGSSFSTSGTGVYGASNGTGVYGASTSTTSGAPGAYFSSVSGDGIYVQGGSGYSDDGVHISSAGGDGVYVGSAVDSGVYVGSANYGVYVGSANYGVYVSSASTGVYVSSATGMYGVYAHASATSGTAYGVYGQSETSNAGYGVYGNHTYTGGDGYSYGVFGRSAATWDAYGVYGYASDTTDDSYPIYGVYGRVDRTSGYGVYSVGNFAATGTKAAIVETKDYGWRHFYAVESPDVLFEDVGTAQLVSGEAVVAIDPVFAQAVNLKEPYQVFLTPQGDCGLYVAAKTATSFAVRALGKGTCSIAFDYRIVAKRLGFEGERLKQAESPMSPEQAAKDEMFAPDLDQPPAPAPDEPQDAHPESSESPNSPGR